MKILLIDLHYYVKSSSKLSTQNSLTLMQLAALTPKKHEIFAIEGESDIDFDVNYDLVAISTITPAAFDAYEIADKFRRRGIKVVIGGWHPSALPNEAKQHADAVFIGEAEKTWPKFLNDLENNEIKDFYRNETPSIFESIPQPRRDIFRHNKRVAPLQVVKGCPVGCEFCCITNSSFKNIPRFKPIPQVIKEINSIKQKYLYFCGSSLSVNLDYSKKLFKSMIGLNKSFSCYCNVDALAKDTEFLSLAQRAGCSYFIVGFESIKPENICSIGKKLNKLEYYTKAVDNVHKYKMGIIGSFVFGFDNDAPSVFEETSKFISKSHIDFPIFIILTPYPGTPLFDRLEKEERILTKDWPNYNLRNVVFQPKNMSPDFLKNEVKNLYKKTYSFYPSVKRMFGNLNRGIYPFINSIHPTLRTLSGKNIHEYKF